MAVLLGLEHRAKTGEGQYIESPQLHSSLLVTTEQCLDADGKLVSGLMVDPEQLGWGPLYRLYRTSDGWLCIACVGDRAWTRLRDALGTHDLDELAYDDAVGEVHGPAVIKALESRLGELTTDEAFGVLDASGVPCEVPLDHPHLPDFLWDEWAFATSRTLEHEHELRLHPRARHRHAPLRDAVPADRSGRAPRRVHDGGARRARLRAG